MDSIPCTDRSKETRDQSHDSVLRINNNSNTKISKNNDTQSPKAHAPLPLSPVTPDSMKEVGDIPFNLDSSPLTGLEKGLFISSDCSSPRTPSNVVFDPFAPGPEDMVLAPLCKKPTRQPKPIVSRRLDFDFSATIDVLEDGSNGAVSLSDDEMIESVYEDLLKVIISMHTKGVVLEVSEGGECSTPPLAGRVNWVADTCPGAPVKRAGKSKNIDLGLCRKLEF